MSLFSNTLQIILERTPGSRSAFAEKAGLPNSTLHNYVHGLAVPDAEALDKMCQALEPADRAELVLAHLRDQTPKCARDLVRITGRTPGSAKPEDNAVFDEIKLPKKIRADFENLMRRAMSDSRVSEWISGTVDLMEGRR